MSTSKSSNALIRFYEQPNGGQDFRGRTLSGILRWSDVELERSHDYVQTLFPLPESSPFQPRAPVVDRLTFDAFQSRSELRSRLRESCARMLEFYGFELSTQTSQDRVDVVPAANFPNASYVWRRRFGHNHLRITRVIRSLRILGLEKEAEAFFQALLKIARRELSVSDRSIMYWTRAAERPLHIAPEEDHESWDAGEDFLREFEERRKAAGDGTENHITNASNMNDGKIPNWQNSDGAEAYRKTRNDG
ncbi:MAG: hypothetical protein M1833_002733 [Piccolia ochrophora]|nr:MAG: hypothetical protein M1833_002733 [Piccolia ochrophora]